jgi:hypothetical protein
MPRVLNFHDYKHDGLPPGAVYRENPKCGLPESKWRIPTSTDEERVEVVAQYARWLLAHPVLMAALPELRGKDLACWCAPLACHGDVLLRLANG